MLSLRGGGKVLAKPKVWYAFAKQGAKELPFPAEDQLALGAAKVWSGQEGSFVKLVDVFHEFRCASQDALESSLSPQETSRCVWLRKVFHDRTCQRRVW